jgi:septal ring factor EnvC (AmiA/AmiB activator)
MINSPKSVVERLDKIEKEIIEIKAAIVDLRDTVEQLSDDLNYLNFKFIKHKRRHSQISHSTADIMLDFKRYLDKH